MQEIQNEQEYANAIKDDKVIIYFTTKWCPDCFFINPHLPAIEEKYKDYKFYKVDRDNLLDLCQYLNILGIPSFIAYSNGSETGRFVSKFRKTKEEVEKFIESL